MLYFYCSTCDICFLSPHKSCLYCSSSLLFFCTINNNSGSYNHFINYHKKHCKTCNPDLQLPTITNIITPYQLNSSVFNRYNKCNRCYTITIFVFYICSLLIILYAYVV